MENSFLNSSNSSALFNSKSGVNSSGAMHDQKTKVFVHSLLDRISNLEIKLFELDSENCGLRKTIELLKGISEYFQHFSIAQL